MEDPPALLSMPKPTPLGSVNPQTANFEVLQPVEPLSISTAQGGSGTSTTSTSTSTFTSTSTSFWLGLGTDCRPACFGTVLCAALRVSQIGANIGAAYLDGGKLGTSVYDVRAFPTSLNGHCVYSSGAYSDDTEEEGGKGDALTVALAYNSTQGAGRATAGVVSEITIWGHSDYTYPLFIQGALMQLGGFEGVEDSVANIQSSGEYTSEDSPINPDIFASTGDFKEVWPALTGRSTLYARLSHTTGSLLLLSAFLKFEDLGAVGSIIVSAPVIVTQEEMIEIVEEVVPKFPGTDVPLSAQRNSDSAAAVYLCDVEGGGFAYQEMIDTAARTRTISSLSCPNHFSHCQSSQCGGEKTRALSKSSTLVLPLYPTFATAPQDTTCTKRKIGLRAAWQT
ncbi:hypothetical protein B484DRAFT_125133 [Ochromonadaceae sp. CCMP2298]|nr:hypothetical protein B484DRAFT_125133 [Ochromonadaceae sp. CCMP2298]